MTGRFTLGHTSPGGRQGMERHWGGPTNLENGKLLGALGACGSSAWRFNYCTVRDKGRQQLGGS